MSVLNMGSQLRKGPPTKKPHCEQRWGSKTAPLLARGAISAAWEGSLAYGFAADYSGGTAADLHSLPRFPCLQK
jgi:hypothetical protein